MKQSFLFFLVILSFSNIAHSQNTIGPTGDVGIGISPTTTLHVFKNVSGNTTPLLILQDGLTTGSTQLQFKGTGKLFNIGVGNNAETTLGLADKFYIYDHSSGSARFVIGPTGNIGIGTTTPGSIGIGVATMDIRGASGGGIFTGTTGSPLGFFYSWTDNDVYAGSSSGNFRFFSNSVERMRIDIAGNVGIGTNAPTTKLEVNINDASTYSSTDQDIAGSPFDGLYINNTSADGNISSINFAARYSGSAIGRFGITRTGLATGHFFWRIRNGAIAVTPELMRLTVDGNLGIGTAAPQTRLHVKDDDSYVGRFESTSHGARDSAGILFE